MRKEDPSAINMLLSEADKSLYGIRHYMDEKAQIDMARQLAKVIRYYVHRQT
jgi:hypothetical protein